MLGSWPWKAHGGTHAMEALSAHLRDRSDTHERGEAERKKGTRGKEPRLQIWKGRRPAHYLPAIVPNPGPRTSGDPCLPGAGERERGRAGRGGWGWGRAVYLGFAHVLLGPLELQPEVGGVWAALEGVQLDPEDALHLQPLPLHPGLGLGLHHEPFLRRRVAPGQEHGCPARPWKEGADSVTGLPAREAPQPGARRAQATPPPPSGAPPAGARVLPARRPTRHRPGARPPELRPFWRRLPRQSLPARGCSWGWDRRGSRRPSLRP